MLVVNKDVPILYTFRKGISAMSQAQSQFPDRLLSQREAAQFLGVSSRYLWTLRVQGKLPYLRIGNRIKYRPEDLRKWAAERVQNA